MQTWAAAAARVQWWETLRMISTSRASSKSGHQSAAVVPAGHSAVVRDRLKATPSTISEDASAERMAAASSEAAVAEKESAPITIECVGPARK